ncbi:MAG: phosphate ABC transporter permease PstA [Lachnospiraceae bacterium]
MEAVQEVKEEKVDASKIQGINQQTFVQKMRTYKRQPLSLFLLILVVTSAVITVGVLLFLIGYILVNGIPNIKPELFEWEYNTENVSMLPSIINTLYMTGLTLLMAVPVGVFSAIYLVEYAKRGNKLVNIVRVTTETLQGIPSIVFGLFGYLMFCIGLKWGYTLLAGAITLAIMVLPVIMRTTEEALLAVPDSYREGSFGLGAGRLRTVFKIVLPTAMPGIFSGIILAIGRIVGETAALIFTAGTVATAATGLFDSTRTLAVHMYCLLSEGLYMDQAYATAVILLVMVLAINAFSSFIAKKFTKN